MTTFGRHLVYMLGGATLLIVASARAGDPPNPRPAEETQHARLKQLESRGKDISLTVFPVDLGGTPRNEVRDAVAVFLERGGVKHIAGTDQIFQPAAGQSLDEVANAFGAAVRDAKLNTDYALFAEFAGAPQRGVDEVRAVIVDNGGNVVWEDRQTPADADFQRIKPTNPMTCCMLLLDRIRPVLGLSNPFGKDVSPGPYEQKMDKATGLPTAEERDAMHDRLETFRTAASNATIDVLPIRVNDTLNAELAVRLAALLKSHGLSKARAGDEEITFTLQPTMNEEKVLWSMARAVREHIRANPPQADYVLFAHDLVAPGQVGAVHFVVCDRKGDWVIVDFQNDHQPDFKHLAPKTEDDCNRLIATRLAGYLK